MHRIANPCRLLAAVLLCLCVPAGAEPADDDRARLHAIATSVLGRERVRASFVEERTLSLLQEPLVVRGRFAFDAPDRFRWETLAPTASRLAVEGDEARLSRGGAERRVDLTSLTSAARWLALSRRLAAGELDAIEEAFSVVATGDPADWQLLLTPRDGDAHGDLRSVELRGGAGALREMSLRFAGGDHSRIRFDPENEDRGAPQPATAEAPAGGGA